jgi:hypothetical protein
MQHDINTTEQLLHADFGRIELAEVKLEKGDPTHYISGRILDRWNNQDLRLRWNGHEHDVTIADEWSLLRFKPVTGIEKEMIQDQWDGVEA